MRSFLLIALFPLLVFGFTAAGCSKSGHEAHASKQKYHCPMHPTYVSDKPGDCPICNMKLVPIKDGEPTASAEAAAQPAAQPGHEGHQGPGAAAAVPGRVAISISPEKQQLMGLTTGLVSVRKLAQPIRTTATLEHDETRLARIAPRFGGWIRELKVNFTGEHVEKGQPLFTVYSPELLSAESEYLLAYERYAQLQNRPDSPQLDSAKRLVDSSRRRLALWEIDEEEIRALEQSGVPRDEVLVRSPVSGHVVAKTAVRGKAFMPGDTLYEIADLSHLWVRAYVYEFEAPLVKLGQVARVTFPYLGNRALESKVSFLYPHIEAQTRRAEIRLEIDNPQLDLRPQMWANVELDADSGEVLTVPASAVIDSGVRLIAFVMRDDSHLEPREVKIGARSDDYYEVLSGLHDGEKVVARALFLIDSESQLKAAISGMGAAGGHNH